MRSPGRFPVNFEQSCSQYGGRKFPLRMRVSGVFAQLREWVGFERLCLLFYDDPDLVSEMIRFWERFISDLLFETCKHIVPDVIYFTEDMAYKKHLMISPAMIRRFVAPTWRHWTEIAASAGVPLRCVDSDGYIHDLLPIWMESGINMCEPVEVAAGNDLTEMRSVCGQRMAFLGGIDKRSIAAGGTTIQEDLSKADPIIQGGGFIPSCDHDGVPPDVSWPDFVSYSKLLAKNTGWLD